MNLQEREYVRAIVNHLSLRGTAGILTACSRMLGRPVKLWKKRQNNRVIQQKSGPFGRFFCFPVYNGEGDVL